MRMISCIACVFPSLLGLAAHADGMDQDRAFSANVTYTGEVVRVLDGGAERGSAFLGNLDVDLQWTFGEDDGITAYVYLLGNHGEDPSELAGDAQGLSNITAPNALRVYEAWVKGTLGPVALKFGLYDLNSEFDVLEVASLFSNSSFGIGPDYAQAGPMGPSIFPITGVGLRAQVQRDDWYGQVAVIDGQPGDMDDERETSLRISRHEGALVAAEVGRVGETDDGGYYKFSLGTWYFTQRFERIDDGELERGNQGAYVSAEGRLAQWGESSLSGFARIGFANSDLNGVEHYEGAGLVLQGLPGRPDDRVGVAVARANFSDAARDLDGLDDNEIAVEINYELPLTDWLTLQPNVQRIFTPGGDTALDDAWVVGSRFILTYSR